MEENTGCRVHGEHGVQGTGSMEENQGTGSMEKNAGRRCRVQGAWRTQGAGCMEENAACRVHGGEPGAGAGGRVYLSGPQVQLLERRQFDEVLSAGTGDIGEGQAEVLQVSEGARAQQPSQVCVLHTDGQVGGFRAGWELPAALSHPPPPPAPSPCSTESGFWGQQIPRSRGEGMTWRLGVSGREGYLCGWQLPDGGKSLQSGDSPLSQQQGCSKAKSSPRVCMCAKTAAPSQAAAHTHLARANTKAPSQLSGLWRWTNIGGPEL